MVANLSAEGLGLGKNTQRISLPTGSLPWLLPKSLHGSGADGFRGPRFQGAMVSRADARSISFWSLGSLALVTPQNLMGIAITTAIGIVIAWKIAPALDRLSLGDATAFHLGVNVARIRLFALIALSILAGGAVSTVGSIAFIGLAAPHIARFIYGPAHRKLVAHSAIIGALIVVVADTASRTIAQPNELPIGLATALLGAPVLIALVAFKNNVWRTQ